MNELYGYPENDWRNYLMHASRGHKYISRKWKNGRWVYTYAAKKSKAKGVLDSIISNARRRAQAAQIKFKNRKDQDPYRAVETSYERLSVANKPTSFDPGTDRHQERRGSKASRKPR